MASFNTAAPLNALKTLVDGLAVTDEAFKGVPEAPTRRVSALVAIGPQRIYMKTTELLERELGLFVEFAYRVDGAEGLAEDALGSFLDQFLAAYYADVTLGGTVATSEIDFSPASDPNYQPMSGQEYRVYPFLVKTKQRSNR